MALVNHKRWKEMFRWEKSYIDFLWCKFIGLNSGSGLSEGYIDQAVYVASMDRLNGNMTSSLLSFTFQTLANLLAIS